MIEVAAAVIERPDGSFLLARRPAGKVYAGWWEFPGGKIEAGEPPQRALARELHEELGIDVVTAYPWITREHVYEHGHVRLNFFRVTEWSGEPDARERQAFAWQRLDAPMAEPMLPANAPVLASLALPLEYAISNAERLGVGESLAIMERRLKAGLRLIQVRDKSLPDRIGFAQEVAGLARRYGAKVLVNGGPDLADGLHFTAAQLRQLKERPKEGLAAASCHTREELGRAAQLDLDFAIVGPVKATATHPGAPLLGWEGFAAIARGASIPVYAIGGLRPSDLPAARRAGAHGLAMIRGSWD
ncbi:MAG TPA: Nudix family hydrolase [Burkholderiales bacterium]|jgi:8-oxo-dGTP diphosphatase|nr:Nudix family hydrolase [Burkholderiales bacterium]